MTIKEYITNRIENCTNLEIKKVFENLLWEFEDKPASKYYSYPKTNDVQDNIDGVFVTSKVEEGIGHAAIIKNPNQIKSVENNG